MEKLRRQIYQLLSIPSFEQKQMETTSVQNKTSRKETILRFHWRVSETNYWLFLSSDQELEPVGKADLRQPCSRWNSSSFFVNLDACRRRWLLRCFRKKLASKIRQYAQSLEILSAFELTKIHVHFSNIVSLLDTKTVVLLSLSDMIFLFCFSVAYYRH